VLKPKTGLLEEEKKDDLDKEPGQSGLCQIPSSLSFDEIIEYGLPLPPDFDNDPGLYKVGRMNIMKNRDIGHGSNGTIVY
jgi:hypothetical protein